MQQLCWDLLSCYTDMPQKKQRRRRRSGKKPITHHYILTKSVHCSITASKNANIAKKWWWSFLKGLIFWNSSSGNNWCVAVKTHASLCSFLGFLPCHRPYLDIKGRHHKSLANYAEIWIRDQAQHTHHLFMIFSISKEEFRAEHECYAIVSHGGIGIAMKPQWCMQYSAIICVGFSLSVF